jgi:hypothetical protein
MPNFYVLCITHFTEEILNYVLSIVRWLKLALISCVGYCFDWYPRRAISLGIRGH